jgi:hypothetical protein
MRASRLALILVLAAGAFFLVRHGDMAIHPELPKDMPKGAHFVQSGYDVSRLEAKGDWIACSTDSAQNTDFCRVTDQRGTVVYQGDFLPLHSSEPVAAEDLEVAQMDADRLWVQGPAEKGPVPVIPLANGTLLVPADDNEALADRWSNNPAELRRISGE